MNILLINHYAGSPEMGMEYRPYYLAQEWLRSGHQVTIIAADNSHIRQKNPKFASNLFEQSIDGVNYIWVKTPAYKGNGLGRVKNIFSFAFKIFKRAKYLADKLSPDVVIASSTYTIDNYAARKVAKYAKAKYIYEVHDLWPLSPMELGNMSKFNPFIMLMQYGENYAYKNCDAVVSMLPKTQEHMKNHGLDLQKWFYVPNGVNMSDWTNQMDLNKKTLNEIEEIKRNYKTIIAYTGTFGIANALKYFIESSEYVNKNAFVLIGKGPERNNLIKIIESNKFTNVFVLEAVSKPEIPQLLSLFDYLYIGLKYEPLFRFGISPNKLIDYMMSGKPVIQAINAGNNMVQEANCGIHVEPENPKAIADALDRLNNMTEKELLDLGQNGRDFVIKNHDYKILAQKMIEIFEKDKK